LEHRQDIVNLKRGMRSSDLRALPHGKLFQDDVLQARSLLTERGWLFEELKIVDNKKEERWGLAFAHPTRLLVLRRRGWFTQFDATHKLNRWGHNMFSFLVRNEHNIWIPTAHLVVERENGEIIAEGLRYIKQWCSGMSGFRLYFIQNSTCYITRHYMDPLYRPSIRWTHHIDPLSYEQYC